MASFDVLTLHPDMLRATLHTSVLGRGVGQGLLHIGVHDMRAFGHGKHRSVDDSPYGGGAGMVMKVDVVCAALDSVRRPDSHVILTSPAGRTFTQADAERLSGLPHVVIVCGHYEGVDARVEGLVDELLSIGDFVLTGGEIAAAAMVDAAARLVPGVLGNDASSGEETFHDDLVEYPQFTRPREWRGQSVPDVLLSGDHARVAAWRKAIARARTARLRPDLWAKHCARHGLSPDAAEGIDDSEQDG